MIKCIRSIFTFEVIEGRVSLWPLWSVLEANSYILGGKLVYEGNLDRKKIRLVVQTSKVIWGHQE